MQEELLVVRPVQQTNGLAAHVLLLFKQFLEVQLHREASESLAIDDKHWLDKDKVLRLVKFEVLLLQFFFAQLLLRDVDSDLDRILVLALVLEVDIKVDVSLFLFLLFVLLDFFVEYFIGVIAICR